MFQWKRILSSRQYVQTAIGSWGRLHQQGTADLCSEDKKVFANQAGSVKTLRRLAEGRRSRGLETDVIGLGGRTGGWRGAEHQGDVAAELGMA